MKTPRQTSPFTNDRRAPLRLTYHELAFILKLLRAEFHFILDEERRARQEFERKLSDITFPGGRDRGVSLFLTPLEISFIQKITKTSYSFLTLAEREARQNLRRKIRAAWDEIQEARGKAKKQA